MSETVTVVIAGTPTPILLYDSNTLESARQAGFSAVSAASAALSEAHAESLSGPTYPDTATGLAATASGDFFAVDNGDGTVTIYLDNTGVAVEQRTLATTSALASATGADLVRNQGAVSGMIIRTAAAEFGDSYKASQFGFSVINSAAANLAILNDAIEEINLLGGGSLTIPARNYDLSGQINLKSNVKIYADGATFSGSGVYLFNPQGTLCDNWLVEGMKIDTDVAQNFGFRLFDVSNFSMEGLKIYRGGSGGYTGMLIGAEYGRVNEFFSDGSNGIWIEGNNLNFSNGNMTADALGGDDCLVVKAPYVSVGEPRASSHTITVTGWTGRNYAAVLSLGSEVGKLGVNDAAQTRRISGVIATGINGVDCAYGVFIKPGANAGQDYRDGVVEGVQIKGVNLIDRTGFAAKIAVNILAGRGGTVQNVNIDGVTALMRCKDQASVNAGVFMSPGGYAVGANPAHIGDITIKGIDVKDIYAGVALSGPTPGHPVDYGVYAEINAAGTPGTFGDVTLDGVKINGTRRSGAYFGNSFDDKVKLKGADFKNINAGAVSSADGGIVSESRIRIKDTIGIDVLNGKPIGYAAQTERNYIGERAHIYVGSTGAGNSMRAGLFQALNASYVTNVSLVDGAGITTDNANYTTFEFRNMGTGNVIQSTTTQTTGGIAFPQDTVVNITTNLIVDDDAYMAAGAFMRFFKSDTGTGRAITDMHGFIDYIPYGRTA
jgi:hypothetical protein